jgi:hypothetical protein
MILIFEKLTGFGELKTGRTNSKSSSPFFWQLLLQQLEN